MSSWSCRRRSDFVLRKWGDGAVLFDDATGYLHSVTTTSADVFDLLLCRPLWSIAALTEELLQEYPSSTDIKMMEELLVHFLSLGLIERNSV